jgi:hypothetical protein
MGHWLVTLDQHEHIAVKAVRRLGNSIASTIMSVGRHYRLAAERLHSISNFGVASCYNDICQIWAHGSPFINVLNHCSAMQMSERFPRKARGIHPSRYNGNCFHFL